jgi:hypothetical protein
LYGAAPEADIPVLCLQDEHELFMTRLKEKGADGEWGIFSMAIPGRVGYQVLYIGIRNGMEGGGRGCCCMSTRCSA